MPSLQAYRNRKRELADMTEMYRKIREAHGRAADKVCQLELQVLNLRNEVLIEKQCSKVVHDLYTEATSKSIDDAARIAELDKLVWDLQASLNAHIKYLAEFEIVPDLPGCLKPLDAIRYAAERIANGPDNLSQ